IMKRILTLVAVACKAMLKIDNQELVVTVKGERFVIGVGGNNHSTAVHFLKYGFLIKTKLML
ncbi:MAG TPA: hypothetical protein VL943_10680, partial [Niabella sp.]|nr:hypothetical protein [Niabella sp.]